jgi:antitoxin ParD1/3/4
MTLNLPLPEEMEKFIDQQVASNGYSNATEYILYLLHQEQTRIKRIESLLLAGLDSGEPIQITEDWWEKKRTQLVQNFDQK